MRLVPGLYENVVTHAIDRAVQSVADTLAPHDEPLNEEGAPHLLARHLFDALVRALRHLPEEDRLGRQVALTNQILALLSSAAPASGIDADESVLDPAKV